MNQCCMSVDLVDFGWRFFVTNTNNVVLSVWIGVGGCVWPISSTVVCAGIVCRKLIYSVLIYASAAGVIKFFMICEMVKTDPLFAVFAAFFDIKTFPAALNLAFDSVR